MRIIIAPAKMMRRDDTLPWQDLPMYVHEAQEIRDYINALSFKEKKTLWACSEKIAEVNAQRYRNMRFAGDLTPAVFAFTGIQYETMGPDGFTEDMFRYVQKHLRILSGLYGVLRPFDGIEPYRLEMEMKAHVRGTKDLPAFWGRKIYDGVMDESHILLNLASKQYEPCIRRYIEKTDTVVTCMFMEKEDTGLKQKGVYAKTARGAMVRWLAGKQIEDIREVRAFHDLGYACSETESDEKTYVFVREKK